MTSTTTSSIKPHIEVIPCKICGDKSSGVHYGVISCEGCKGFFRRWVNSRTDFCCSRQKTCDVNRASRNRCQYCRLQKCMALGMSKDAVKFGRMSKRQREKVLKEVQKLDLTRVPGEADHIQIQGPGGADMEPNRPISPPNYAIQPDTTQPNGIHPPIVASIISRTMTEKELKKLQLEYLGTAIAMGHYGTCLYTPEEMENMRRAFKENRQHLFDPSWPKDRVWLKMAEYLTSHMERIVEFAKTIPGFLGLSEQDQITLLKSGGLEVILVRIGRLFDHSSGTFPMWDGHVTLAYLKNLGGFLNHDCFFESMFDLARNISTLNLTEEEIALFSAVVLIAGDRQGLSSRRKVEDLQERILDCFTRILHMNHPGESGLLARVLMFMPTLRTISTSYAELMKLAVRENPHLNFPALHIELFTDRT